MQAVRRRITGGRENKEEDAPCSRYAGSQKENNRRAREQGRGCTMFLSWSRFFSEAPYYYLKDERLRKERST
jgi:hypothetical protein